MKTKEWTVKTHTSSLGETGDTMTEVWITNGELKLYAGDALTDDFELQEICDTLNASQSKPVTQQGERSAEEVRENHDSILLDISINVQDEILRQCRQAKCDDWQTDVINNNVTAVFDLNKEKYLRRLSACQPPSPAISIEELEDNFVNRLLAEVNKLGYDTGDCDGDTDPAEIIAKWFHCRMGDLKAELQNSEAAHDLTLDMLVKERESQVPSIEELGKVLRGDNAWPLCDILNKLIEAAEILLNDKNYDGHGWEEISCCVKEGKKVATAIYTLLSNRRASQPSREQVIEVLKDAVVQFNKNADHRLVNNIKESKEGYQATAIIKLFANSRASQEAETMKRNPVSFEQAQQQVERLNGEGWVSVEQALPDSMQSVLCIIRDSHERFMVNSYATACDQDEAWFIRKFSHWQPLPSPPLNNKEI